MKHSVRGALLIILLAHFALGIQYSLRLPLGEAPDEADHWAYTVYLATERRLPVGPDLTQAKHPPLYYFGAALFAALDEPTIDFFRPNPAVNLEPGPDYSPNFFQHGTEEQPPWSGGPRAYHLTRLWSLLLSMGTVAATAATARAAFPHYPALPLAAAGITAFIPEFLFISGSINNDNGAAFCGALALWGMMAIYASGGVVRRGWWTPLALGGGVLVKVSSLALWPVAGLALFLGILFQEPAPGAASAWRRILKRTLGSGLLLFVPSVLLILPLLLRNRRLYGDLFGMSMALQTIDQRTTPWTGDDTLWLLRGWYSSFWGKFGGAGHLPMAEWVYALLGALSTVSVLGLALLMWRGGWRWERTPALILATAAAAVAVVMARYSLIALGTDQGRLLYPALGAIGVLVAAGFIEWAPARLRLSAALLLTLLMAALGIYGLWGVIVPTFAGT